MSETRGSENTALPKRVPNPESDSESIGDGHGDNNNGNESENLENNPSSEISRADADEEEVHIKAVGGGEKFKDKDEQDILAANMDAESMDSLDVANEEETTGNSDSVSESSARVGLAKGREKELFGQSSPATSELKHSAILNPIVKVTDESNEVDDLEGDETSKIDTENGLGSAPTGSSINSVGDSLKSEHTGETERFDEQENRGNSNSALHPNQPDQADKTHSRSSSLTTATTPRKASTARVDNTAIFTKTFEAILQSKDAQKNPDLKGATEKAIASLANSASRDPHVLFDALKLACESANTALKCQAVDLFAKLFDYASFGDEEARTRLTDASVDVISACFDGEGTDPELEMQVVRALTHSIVLMPTHGAALLKAVRQIYNVFIFSLTPRNQSVAQGTLAQVVGTVFGRVSHSKIGTVGSASDISLRIDTPKTTSPNTETTTLEALQQAGADARDHDRVKEASHASVNDADLAVKDAFLVFRAMCKLSVKDVDGESVDMRSHAVRSKLLSLHVIHNILRNNIDVFLSHDVVLLSANSDDNTRLLDAVRSYLCQSLIRNATSSLAPVFELTLETFWLLISNLRSDFKMEIPVLWEQIYFPVAEMKTSTPHQKRYLLSVIERLCNDSRCLIEFYLNYDCDSRQFNVCEAIIDYLTRLSLLRVEVSAVQKLAFQEHRATGISLYDVSKIDNLTSSTMSSKPPEPDVYTLFPIEYAMKITSLGCALAFLRSLHSWAQKGLVSPQKVTNFSLKSNASASSYPTRDNSRNQSFIGDANSSTDFETDDVDQFETQKQRKKAFVEGTRQFSQKPKKGIAYFLENDFIKSDDPEDIATFLLSTETLDKAALGDFLGDGNEKNVAIMHAFVDQMNFEDSSFVDSLRLFLQSFRLPGEGQKIDRFMLKFAERYVLGNPGIFSNADAAYVLAYSTVMLNTDQHSKSVKNRMTVDNFIMNNSKIDDGKDLPREFLEQVFSEIQKNEIKLQSEYHAALLAGDQNLTPTGQSGFFSSRDWNREAYIHASKEMSTKTEKLVKNLGKKSRAEDSNNNIYYSASNVLHVKSIFDTTWMSILAGLTGPFKEYDEPNVIKMCLEGIKISIKISCMFDLQYAKKSFIGALLQFQNLNNIEDIKAKNVDAMHVMLELAVSEGDYLQKSWIDVLTSISQLERLQLIAKGIDGDSIPDVSAVRLVNRNSLESTSSQPSGFFSSFTRETSASQSASIKYHNQQLSPESAELLSRTHLSVAIDKIFTNSAELTGESIKDFVEALSQVATEEIASSGQSSNPRMFSLQKVVDICYYNMSRIRLEWSQLWVTLGEIFRRVGCNPNLTVDFFALDSLRQLSMRFMEIEELAHFKFQKEFLKPFHYIIVHNSNTDVKDMVLECINNMMLAKSSYIKSGWKTIFEVLTAAARGKQDSLVTKAYKLASTINKEFSDEVIKQDSFADLVTCFTEFAKNEQLQKVGLLSLEVLSRLIVRVGKTSIELNSKRTISAKRDSVSEKYDNLMKLWFPLLYGFSDIIMCGEELEVRSRTLTLFFDILLKYGNNFETDFWDLIYKKLLAPIFGVIAGPWGLNYDDQSASYGASVSENDKMSFWVSTTFIQALNGMISLFSHYFDALTPRLDDLFKLLVSCICQENDTIARTGKACLERFLEQNCDKYKELHWDMAAETFERLFDLTTAKELFELDPMREHEISGIDSFNITNSNNAQNKGSSFTSESTSDKSAIVVKCVLQLLMIESVSELLAKDKFYDNAPEGSIMKISMLLHKSYTFAKKFNDDYDLRVRLWNAGIIEKLPNLLKQESMSAAVFLNATFRLYCDNMKVTSQSKKKSILATVVPLCYSIVKRYVELDETNQQKTIATWRPVITEVFEGYVELDNDDFKEHSPALYRLTLSLWARNMGVDLCKALQQFMARVGDVFVK